MTVAEAKTKKMELEINLNKILTDFEKETECRIQNIDITSVTTESGESYIAVVKIVVEM